MDCTATLPQKSKTFSPFTAKVAPAVQIELQGIIVEHGKLFIFLTDGQRNRICSPKAKVLLSFPRFRDFVLDEVGVLVTHRSQDAASSRRRRLGWEAVLEQAYDRGCGR